MGAWDILSGSYKYMKRGGIIPSEMPGGQLSMFPHGFGRIPKRHPLDERAVHSMVMRGIRESGFPPFPSTRRSLSPSGTARNLARKEELAAKKAAGKRVPGRFYKADERTPIHGPLTSEQSKIDDLFGVQRPIGYH